ncbi:hypothetical protein [Shewanella sp. GutDb-MelDb]|uniref:hypothetical protein n=1 Tax=Shewanella sp. GutDb-MelDb TaxID=2058316 RepID=UPI000C7E1F53|nr:hypothetical protein [Shewanella sp. GutDb-MelDb]PKG59125.1 hypothetical protein CXF82_00895 [Shewanella sp. GutDb-MelDb]
MLDWQAFIDFLRCSEATLNYFVEGEPTKLPASIAEVVVSQDHPNLLTIGLDGVTVNCHFFIPEEIELDIDPRDIDSEARAKVVFEFMSTVGKALNKQVILTPENTEEQPLFTYEPGASIKHLALNKSKHAEL